MTPTTEASGPHDFAVRRRAVRLRAWAIAHGSIRPALRSHLRARTAASTAPRPNVRDDGQRPSFGTGWQSYSLTSISEKQKYFLPRDWTGQITLIRFNKLDFSRNAPRARLGRAALPVRANQSVAVARRERCEASQALRLFPLSGRSRHQAEWKPAAGLS